MINQAQNFLQEDTESTEDIRSVSMTSAASCKTGFASGFR